MGGDDAVVEHRDDVRLGGEQAEGGCVVLLAGGRLDDGDSQMLVALGEVNACGEGAGLCIAGDGGVAIEDEVAVGDELVVSIWAMATEGSKRDRTAASRRRTRWVSGVREGRFMAKKHGCTSLLH